ncbi:MAG: hypothetical protein AAF745_04440 [Planctomycetota bacterium]
MMFRSKYQVSPMRCTLVGCQLFMVALLCLRASTGIAGPSGNSPQQPLEVIGWLPEAKELAIKTAALRVDAEEELVKWIDPEMAESKSAVNAVVKLKAKIAEGQSNAKDLKAMLEPIGDELDVHFEILRKRCYSLGRRVAGTPSGRVFKTKALTQIQRDTQRRQKLLASAKQAVEAGNPDGARQMVQKTNMQLSGLSCLYSTTVFNKAAPQFWGSRNAIDDAFRRSLTNRAEEAIPKRIEAEQKQLEGILQKATELSTLSVEDETNTETLLKSVNERLNQWRQQWTLAVVTQCRLLSLHSILAKRGSPVTTTSAVDADRFTNEMAQQFATLIKSAADRGEALSGTTDVLEILRSLAIPQADAILTLCDRETTKNMIASTIETLTQRHAPLAKRVTDYRAATQEILRWRRRQVDAWLRHKKVSTPSMTDVLLTKRVASKSARPEALGAIPSQPTEVASPVSIAPAPWQASETAARLEGVKVILGPSRRLSTTRTRHLSRLQVADNGSAVFSLHNPASSSGSPVRLLRIDLLLKRDQLPPSFEAYRVWSDANRLRTIATIAEIEDVTIESLAARLVNLPASVKPLISHDQFETDLNAIIDQGSGGLLPRLAYRLQTQPTAMVTDAVIFDEN